MTTPTYFPDAPSFRAWLETHAATAPELSVGFRKKATGQPSITWPEARDEALCFGWIDGVRHRIDDESYRIRFTPRRKGSIWSKVNVARFAALTAEGRMTEAGVRAYQDDTARGGVYAYERPLAEFTPAETALFRKDEAAWADWERRPPGYRKICLNWVTSAKKPETRARRLATLIADSAAGRKIGAVDIARKPG
ncbi:MAG TPA: YdeI/OmpD-associated family protein [Allosphingosinicella sp.]|nr:YdeI/OmpD-associated family protein [Allosphingosinicella sp.]